MKLHGFAAGTRTLRIVPTSDQLALLDQLVAAFETHGAALIYSQLSDDQRADVQVLIIDGLAECRPPGPLEDATHVIPSSKARSPAAPR